MFCVPENIYRSYYLVWFYSIMSSSIAHHFYRIFCVCARVWIAFLFFCYCHLKNILCQFSKWIFVTCGCVCVSSFCRKTIGFIKKWLDLFESDRIENVNCETQIKSSTNDISVSTLKKNRNNKILLIELKLS